jgi:hypothetical protein
MVGFQDEIEIEGHLIDSGILKYAFDKIVELEGQYEVLQFEIGRNNQEPSRVQLMVKRKYKRRKMPCTEPVPGNASL